jgi:hypothetical protein
MRSLLLLTLMAGSLFAQPPLISADRLRAHIQFLASDLLEGRGTGSRGGDLATAYLASQFAVAGAQPAGENGTYFQRVPLVGVKTLPASAFAATASDGKQAKLTFGEDLVGVDQKQIPQDSFEAEAVFVGHGITAPEFGWDDFKGVDVRGKVLVLFTNEPASADPKFFGGRALTYYGRWSYKYEEAQRRGARAAIIIHTNPTAGYGWSVVRNSWGGEQPLVQVAPGENPLGFSGWVTEQAGRNLMAMAGANFDDLLRATDSRDFRPVPLGLRFHFDVRSAVRQVETRNVIARVAGSDPALANEAVIFSGHWDHLGIGPAVNGDTIYNGAVDNATGCAMLIELARAWANLPQKPRRSAIFLVTAAEEGGLRGSEYYAAHPVVPAGKTALVLNYDGFQPLGRTHDIVLTGAERTTLWPLIQEVARRFRLEIKPDPQPEQGHFYRSDHFPMAHAGIPAFSVSQGEEVIGKPKGYGEKLGDQFSQKRYHQPSDEYDPSWDVSGMQEVARFGFVLATETANGDRLPTWRAGDEFLAAREASGVK